MTVLQVKADHVQPKAVTPKGQKHTIVKSGVTPLERELEAVEGISLKQLGQPVAEVVGRVSVVTPTTASRARFHPQLWHVVAMFCGPKLARQGVGGCRDLPR